MKFSEEFYKEWEKHKIPYKVMVYLCGCKYIYITEEKKRIFKEHPRCPEHRKSKLHILLWCEVCGLKIEAKPQSGGNQKRCYPCGYKFMLEYNRLNFKPRYGKRYKQKPKKQVTELQEAKKEDRSLDDIKYLAVAKFIKSMKLNLPVVETPILDKIYHRAIGNQKAKVGHKN